MRHPGEEYQSTGHLRKLQQCPASLYLSPYCSLPSPASPCHVHPIILTRSLASRIYPLLSMPQHCSDPSRPSPAWRPTALSLSSLPTPAPSFPKQTLSSQCQLPEATLTTLRALPPSQLTRHVLPSPSKALAPASLRTSACAKP